MDYVVLPMYDPLSLSLSLSLALTSTYVNIILQINIMLFGAPVGFCQVINILC